MSKIEIKLLYLLILTSLLFPSFSLAQEQVNIITYYPSPYGIYERLQTEELFLRRTGTHLDPRLAISRSGDILEINNGSVADRFEWTEFWWPTIVDGSLVVGSASIPGPGNMGVTGIATINDELTTSLIIVNTDLNVGNNIYVGDMEFPDPFVPGLYSGITVLRQFTSGSGNTYCPPSYYAIMALDNNRQVPYLALFGTAYMRIPESGYLVCVRHAD